jgi:hypothetical protein
MLVEAIERPLQYRFTDGRQVRLAPGHPVDIPEPQAKALLAKAPNRVRIADVTARQAEAFVMESAPCPNPVYWESNGQILGPGTVTHFGKETVALGVERFWLCVTYRGACRWVHESLLRTRAAYEAEQRKAKR